MTTTTVADAGQQVSLLARAEAAYDKAVRDPAGQGDPNDLVALCRSAGDAEALVVALRAAAWCARHELDPEQAKRWLDEAVRVARRRHLDARLVEVLATRAAVSLELGRSRSAQHDLDTARRLSGTAPPPDVSFQQAVLHHNRARLAAAAPLYAEVLDSPSAPAQLRVKAANNLALIETSSGDYDDALARLDSVRDDARSLGPALVAIVEDSRGWVLVQSGRLVEGLRGLAEAAERHREAGLPLGEHYLEHCDALTDLRLLPEAFAMATRAEQEFSSRGVGLLAAEAQLRLARLGRLVGRPAVAEAAGRTAGDMFRRQRRTAWAAQARVLELEARAAQREPTADDARSLRRAARSLERSGIVSWAADAYLAAGQQAARAGLRRAAADSLGEAGRLCAGGPALLRLKGHLAGARRAGLEGDRTVLLGHVRAGFTDLAEHRAALASTELRALASGHGTELGQLALRQLLQRGSAAEVLAAMERTRAATLLVAAPPAAPHLAPMLAELRDVQEELSAVRAEEAVEPPALIARQRQVEARIRRASWTGRGDDGKDEGKDDGRASGREGGPVPLAELRRLLAGRSLVEYAAVDGELVAVVVRPARSELVRLGPVGDAVAEGEHLEFAVRRLAHGAPGRTMAARLHEGASRAVDRLRELLVAPLRLTPGDPLVVVPSSVLWRLPWAHLCQASVAVAPSSASWARTASRPAPGREQVAFVAGPDLAWSATEVRLLARLHPGADVLVPPDSTVDATVARLRDASLAHLACHGRLRADNPTFSSFLLSRGELTVHELDAYDVAPHRVVLSACDSGADQSVDGGDFIGFVSALLGRGTAGLLASWVLVSDQESVPLMQDVHRALRRGDTLSDALHAATGRVDVTRPEGFAVCCAFNAYGAA